MCPFSSTTLSPFLGKAYSQKVAEMEATRPTGFSLENLNVKTLLQLLTIRSFLQSCFFFDAVTKFARKRSAVSIQDSMRWP